MSKYNLTVDKEQLIIIAEALEHYARMRTGQLDKISDLFFEKDFDREALDYCMRQAKVLLFPEIDSSTFYSIYGENTSRDAKVAYDIYKPILHEFSKNSKHWSVHSTPHDLLASGMKAELDAIDD